MFANLVRNLAHQRLSAIQIVSQTECAQKYVSTYIQRWGTKQPSNQQIYTGGGGGGVCIEFISQSTLLRSPE